MRFILGDYFDMDLSEAGQFDGIVTDPPFKGAFRNKLGEQDFDFNLFMDKSNKETKPVSFLITFANFLCAVDFVNAAKQSEWKFHDIVIWDKHPYASHWGGVDHPLGYTEYVVFFTKGPSKGKRFEYSFQTGEIKKPYQRGGGGVKGLSYFESKELEASYGHFGQIVQLDVGGEKMVSKANPNQVDLLMSEVERIMRRDNIEEATMDLVKKVFNETVVKAIKQFRLKAEENDAELVVRAVYQRLQGGAGVESIEGTIIEQSTVKSGRIHATQKPKEFSYFFAKLVGLDKFVLDPFCGSGSLLTAFPKSIGIDIVDWTSGEARQRLIEAEEAKEAERAAKKAAKKAGAGAAQLAAKKARRIMNRAVEKISTYITPAPAEFKILSRIAKE